MKKITIYRNVICRWILVLILTLASTACNKFLTLYPQDGLVREEFWQNKEQISAAVTGMYSSMIFESGSLTSSGNLAPRTLAEALFIWGELRADNITSSNLFSTADQYSMTTGNILPTNQLTRWDILYKVINNCNTIIDFAPAVLAKDNTLTQSALDAYVAEALTVRALMYFYLVRTFRDVPLKLKSTSSDTDITQLAKSTDAQILAQITGDLEKAATTAAFSYPTTQATKGRITRYTVWALQADIALWMEKYQDCIDACDKIINSQQFGLVNGDSNFYNTLYFNGNSNESIFELQFNQQALNTFYLLFTQQAQLQPGPNIMGAPSTVTGGTSSGGAYAFVPDPVDDTNFDIRPSTDMSDGGSRIIKYTNGRTSDVSYQHWIIYRYADILLMKAEACAWVGSAGNLATRGQDALDLIQRVRRRAHAIYTTLETPSNTDSEAISEYVLHERNREFIFEGKRWFDLLRNAKRDYPNHLSLLTNAVATTVQPQFQQKLLAAFQDKNFFYLPIYYTELQYDPNLVQNPYYK